jgi:hypothetical protein
LFIVDILTRTKKSLSCLLLSAVAAFLLLIGIGDAHAQERPAWRDDPLGNRFVLGAGPFWARLDTKVRLDSSSGRRGTAIDFESTLGMDENDVLPIIQGYYRVAKNHRITFEYFQLNRNGAAVSDVPIRFGDVIFPANLPLSSYFDVDVYALSYAYSLIHDEKKELAFNVGLQFQDIEIGIAGNLGPGILREDADVVAPLPTFGGTFDYAFNEKWVFTSLLGVFAIELDLGDDSEFAGEIVQLNVGVAYNAFKNVGLALQYNYFRVDVDVNDPDWIGFLKYEYRGPVLAVVVYF